MAHFAQQGGFFMPTPSHQSIGVRSSHRLWTNTCHWQARLGLRCKAVNMLFIGGTGPVGTAVKTALGRGRVSPDVGASMPSEVLNASTCA
jgi:hypothetical protein